MSMKKKYLKNKPVCKVTFSIAPEEIPIPKNVYLVGDFNNWNLKTDKMKPLKNGTFTTTIDLTIGQAYQFRYLMDGARWENDDSADAYEYSDFGNCDNSVVII